MGSGDKMFVWFGILLLSTLYSVESIHDRYIDVETYHGYTVLRTVPRTKEQVEYLVNLPEDHLDYWTEPGLNRNVDIMTTPDYLPNLVEDLEAAGLSFTQMGEDVQRMIEFERRSVEDLRMKQDTNFSIYNYNEYPQIVEHLYNIAETVEEAEVEVIGQSWEGRDLVILKLCSGGCGNKPGIWLDGGIHAREWISPATALWTIDEVLSDPSMLTDLDWYFMPVVNPDGYTFTHEHTRLWRKTRSYHNSLLGCRGTDANRNFGHHWNDGGSSGDKCFDTYHGPEAFSEPETAAIRDFILARNGNIKYYNNMHSYSQFVLMSWGYTTDPPPNYLQAFIAADKGVEALHAVNGTDYIVGCIPCILYVASGGASDWAMGAADVPYAFSMELRDTGRYGFLLPPSFIEPVGRETWQFHKAVAMEVIAHYSK